MHLYSMKKYVDDCNINSESVGHGTRWITTNNKTKEGTLRWSEECEQQDLANNRSHSNTTLECTLGMANSISESLTFT